MKTRAQLIQSGKLWQVYRDETSDDILFEGSKSACCKFVREKFGWQLWKRGEIRIGQLLWENGPKEHKSPFFGGKP